MNSTAIVPAQDAHAAVSENYDGLTMVVSPSEAQRRVQELQAFVQRVMIRDVDYGVIPGSDKPTLLQPGAQKMAEVYGFGHRFEVIEQQKDWERGFFYFEYRCVLFSRRDGREVGSGIGSCNSRESKYAARWVFENEVPEGLDPKSLKTREGKSRKTGKPYKMYCVPNPDPYSLVNTLQKMAAKRAYIHAVIAATRSSGLLTQDVEDLPPDVFGAPERARSWEADADTGEVREAAASKSSYVNLADSIRTATDVEQLKAVWQLAASDRKSGKLSASEHASLKSILEEAKASLARPVPSQPKTVDHGADKGTDTIHLPEDDDLGGRM